MAPITSAALRFRAGVCKALINYSINDDICIGCGACAYVCPTGHIEMETTENKRKIWGRTFKMQTCDTCGRYFAPVDQLKYISKKTGVPIKDLSICMDCR